MKPKEQHQIFDHWLEKHRALLFKVVRAYAFNAGDQDDLFQEISLQVWRSIPNFRQESAVTTWLYRIALNVALKWKGNEQKQKPGKEQVHEIQYVLHQGTGVEDERLIWLYQEITRLNEVDRSLCLLLLDDVSYREMAQILGISESNVAVKIHRIKKYLTERSKKMYQTNGI